MLKPIICLIGLDGTGKTTLARCLLNELDHKNIPANYLWFRRPYFLTFLVLGISKLLGFTQYIKTDLGNYTKFRFNHQPFKTIYQFSILIDVCAYYILKIGIPRRFGITTICDRWIPDIVVDISIDVSNYHFDRSIIGRVLELLSSKATLIMAITASNKSLLERRPSLALEFSSSNHKKNLYDLYVEKHRIVSLSSDCPIHDTYKALKDAIKNFGICFIYSKIYLEKYAHNYLFRAILRHRSSVIVINWLFQGIAIMTMSEQIFRLLSELAFFLVFYIPLSLLLTLFPSIVLSLALAHTFEWLLNGGFWGTQKFFGTRFNPNKKLLLLERLKNTKDPSIEAIAAFGGLSRGRSGESSDIDIRIIRKRGVVSWVRANLFLLKLRSTSFLKKIPVDVFLLENINQVYTHISPKELPIVIYDPQKVFYNLSKDCLSLEIGKNQMLEPSFENEN